LGIYIRSLMSFLLSLYHTFIPHTHHTEHIRYGVRQGYTCATIDTMMWTGGHPTLITENSFGSSILLEYGFMQSGTPLLLSTHAVVYASPHFLRSKDRDARKLPGDLVGPTALLCHFLPLFTSVHPILSPTPPDIRMG
jgi:hypothetical protein